jgi:hypothetical protein
MRRYSIFLFVAAFAAPALAIVPIGPIPVAGTRTTINNGPGDQNDPHVSGDLAAYTDGTAPESIRYFDFVTNTDQAIAAPTGASDSLSDVSGSNIVFTRASGACDSIIVFNAGTSTTNEVAPANCPVRFGSAIGGSTVAYVDFSSGSGVIFAADLSGGTPTQLSPSASTSQNPAVSPSGNIVLWEQCSSSLLSCDVMQSVRTGGVWGAATLVASGAANPDSDDAYVVYDQGGDIFIQPVAGGAATQLAISGVQRNPNISGGVIAFESAAAAGVPADIFIYVFKTNTLYQVTNSPTVNDQLNDVSVLSSGQVRVVWAANDGLLGDYNIYAVTFTPTPSAQQQLANLANTISGFSLPHGTANSLLAKVDAATASLAAGDTTAACNELNALINEAQAQSGKKLTADQAKAITDLAQALLTALGCQ